MKNFFAAEGQLVNLVSKTGELIILSILWIICSIPIVTIGASSSALYYATAKAIRRDRGYCIREFWNAFKRNLLKGSLITIILLLLSGLVLFGREYISIMAENGINVFSGKATLFYVLYDGLLIIISMISVFIFPILSRFDMKINEIIKLAFVISIRYFYFTIVLIVVTAVLIFMQCRLLPFWTVIIIPGVWTFLSSFIVEKAMKKYITVTEDNKDEWYIF